MPVSASWQGTQSIPYSLRSTPAQRPVHWRSQTWNVSANHALRSIADVDDRLGIIQTMDEQSDLL